MTSVIIAHPAFLFFVGFLGLFCHFLKKEKFNQLEIEKSGFFKTFYKYFFVHDVKNTIYVGIGFAVGYVLALQLGELGIYSMFLTGYSADSLFNKADGAK